MTPLDPPLAPTIVSDVSSVESVTPRSEETTAPPRAQVPLSVQASRDWYGDLLWLRDGNPPGSSAGSIAGPTGDEASNPSWLNEAPAGVVASSPSSLEARHLGDLRDILSPVAFGSHSTSAAPTTFDDGAAAAGLAALLDKVELEINNTPMTKDARDKAVVKIADLRLSLLDGSASGVSEVSPAAAVDGSPVSGGGDGVSVSGGGHGTSVAVPVASSYNDVVQPCSYPSVIHYDPTSFASTATLPGFGGPPSTYVPPVLSSGPVAVPVTSSSTSAGFVGTCLPVSTAGHTIPSGSVPVGPSAASHSDTNVTAAPAPVPVPVNPPEGERSAIFYDTPVRSAPGPSATDVEVVISKEERLKLDVTNYDQLKILEKIRGGLDDKFGVSSKDSLLSDKSEAGDNVKNVHVQVSATKYFDLIAQTFTHFTKYDMLEILDISPSKSSDPDLSKPISEILDLQKSQNLLWEWQWLRFEDVCVTQALINTSVFVCAADNQSSNLMYRFLYNSCTSSLKQLIDKEFKELPASKKGGLTYLWLLLHTVLRQTPGVSTSLVQFIKLWSTKGPALVNGNLFIGGKQLKNALSLLYGAGRLEQDTPNNLWKGASLSRNKFLSKIAEKNCVEADEARLSLKIYDALNQSQQSIYDKSVAIVDTIMDAYADQTAGGKRFADVPATQDNRFNNLSGRRSGVPRSGVPGGGGPPRGGGNRRSRPCYNCEQPGCSVKKCKKTLNQERIDRNIELAKRGEFGVEIPERAAATQPQQKMVDGFCMAYCKHCQCYVKDHSTKYHDKWSADKSGFNMFDVNPSHPLVVRNKEHFAALVASRRSGSDSVSALTVPPGDDGGQAQRMANLNSILSELEKRVSDEHSVNLVNAARANAAQGFR